MASTIRTMTLNVATLSVPVALKTASERKLPTFSQASPDGNKFVRFVGNADSEALVETEEDAKAISEELGTTVEVGGPRYKDTVTDKVFEEDEIKRGVWDGDTFYAIEKDEIEKIETLTKLDDLTIQTFVPLDKVPWERVKGGYYLTPNKGAGLKALNLLRVAMAEEGVGGVALLCPKSRVHLALIYPRHDGMIVSTLAFAEEWEQVRDGAAALSDPRGAPTEQEVEMARTLVQALSDDDATLLDGIKDLQAEMKADLVERAKMGKPLTEEAGVKQPRKVRVTDSFERMESPLERALRESIEQAQAAKKKPSKKKAAARKTSRATTSRKKAAARKT